MAFYSIKEQDNLPGTEASVHAPQASEEPVIFQSRVTSVSGLGYFSSAIHPLMFPTLPGHPRILPTLPDHPPYSTVTPGGRIWSPPTSRCETFGIRWSEIRFVHRVSQSGQYHIPTWLHYADGAITELKQVIKTVKDFLSVHPELDLNVKDQIFKTAAWTHDLLAIQVSVHKVVDNPLYIPKYTVIAQYLHALKPYHLQLHATKAEHSVIINCVHTVFPPLSSAPAPQVPHMFPEISVHQLNQRRAQSMTSMTTTANTPHKVIIPGLPTLPGYQRTRPKAEVASASTAAESMTIKANLLQGTSDKMDIDNQGTPSQMGHSSLSTTTKSQKCHLCCSKNEHPLSFESDHKKAQLRGLMFNNFLQAIDVPSLANFEGQPPSAILAVSNYHTIKYLDSFRRPVSIQIVQNRAVTLPMTNKECIFMARY
ncbi:hypothetical protein BT96DRAFT_1002922 [Gymnopus androsaceus JB14]|uniref:Uncharacterized protein n=1 Tax=Gymnopus androsaceus JB14 TaxID=1447944 RepID=A0A6A4GVA6_9AGAR|nr:hypothetical protein BT96DRAFT_1002922 [Gymnopus androsaceus JB14]